MRLRFWFNTIFFFGTLFTLVIITGIMYSRLSDVPRFRQKEKQLSLYGAGNALEWVSVPCAKPAPRIPISLPKLPKLPVDNSSTRINESSLSENITIVTGYFNLGTFKKGNAGSFTHALYQTWMERLALISNPMVIVTDDNSTEKFLRSIRTGLNPGLTRFIRVNRSTLWSFNLLDSITSIYNVTCYPQHHPNTVVPAYSAIMHAKYDMISHVIQENYFRTRYFAWLDVGYFRDEQNLTTRPFRLALPKGFDPTKIAFTEVYDQDPKLTMTDIVLGNKLWVGGGYFIGRYDVMLKWVQDYREFVVVMLRSGLMSTDQQVIYSMKNDKNFTSRVGIQVYRASTAYHEWFTLGYMSKEAGETI